MKTNLTLMDKFIKEIGKIKEIEIFFGIAKLLGVKLYNLEKKEVREFNDVFSDVLANYEKADKKRQRELLSLLKDANNCKENVNADSTESAAKEIPNKEV